MKQIAQDLWLLHYKAPLLGDYLGRNVTLVRLRSGDLVIHSTGPFTPEDVEAIKGLGRPAFMLDALSKHDTFAKEGRAAFPDLPYYGRRVSRRWWASRPSRSRTRHPPGRANWMACT